MYLNTEYQTQLPTLSIQVQSARVLEYKVQSAYIQVYRATVLEYKLPVFYLKCIRIQSTNAKYSSTECLSTK